MDDDARRYPMADQNDRTRLIRVVREKLRESGLPTQQIVNQHAKIIAEAVLADGWVHGGPDEHVIEFREDGWTIKHPIACRPHLFDCPVNQMAERDLLGPPAQLGRFVCEIEDDMLVVRESV